MNKYYFVVLEERNGEQEYSIKSTKVVSEGDTIDNLLDRILKQWYPRDEEPPINNGWYEFFGGSLMAKVDRYEEITKEEYEVLSKFI